MTEFVPSGFHKFCPQRSAITGGGDEPRTGWRVAEPGYGRLAGIALLYGGLARRTPCPVVEVNRAVAVGMADGAHAGLAVLEPVLASGALAGYGPLHIAHADLLDRAGDPAAAAAAWARAIEAAENPALRSELQRPVAERSGGDTPSTTG